VLGQAPRGGFGSFDRGVEVGSTWTATSSCVESGECSPSGYLG